MATRAYHHGNLREELLDRAERTVVEQGVDALSLRELAREVGVSHAAPRRHFADRDALLDALAEQGFARLGVQLRGALLPDDDAFAARYVRVATAYVDFATEHAELLALMFRGKQRPGAEAVAVAADAAFRPLFGLVAEGQACGALAAGDGEDVGIPLYAGLHGLASLLTAGVLPAERRGELIEGVCAAGLRGAAPR
ncbi:TetR/AcrR family transcriptional regulator [Kineococcus rubinsiae]|uniref:TetR/AcrR family transcriptional regulator n=1 Tax=Kineococcus rubinsiae TaxID=2609562 RepID=UPI001430B0E3|nr:TetR/AcrR family transcriptional regulator [Kineococcus rubinsiae]NIZ91079.1 TetR/AcrR family transcriptional regulator [Kineococcus rubinsiae]